MKLRGFTLVEVLIVVLILGIIAAVALPRFSNASATARASMLADDLRVLRMQLEVFKGQHGGIAPGYPGCDASAEPTEAAFVTHLTQASDFSGKTAAPGTAGYRYGPYLREMPANPVNGKSTVRILPLGATIPEKASDQYGYLYQPSSMTFKADSSGEDESKKSFFDY